MKVSLDFGNRALDNYTYYLLSGLIHKAGLELVPLTEAQVALSSQCDPDDLPSLRRVSKEARKRGIPLIMGGADSYSGECYLAWVDAIVVGEGFDFFETWGREGLDGALLLPCILTRQSKQVIPSRHIDWQHVPLVHIKGTKYYALASKGCLRHCAFCMSTWTSPWIVAPQHLIQRFMAAIPKNGYLNLISNDHSALLNGQSLTCRLAVSSATVQQYLKHPASGKQMQRFGIERVTEDDRRHWGKPISNADLVRLWHIIEAKGIRSEWFFIVGLPGDTEALCQFIERLPQGAALRPTAHIQLNYFDPVCHTPLWTYSLSQLEPIDFKVIGYTHLSRNRRWRLWRPRSLPRAMWRCLLHRCNPDEALVLGAAPEPSLSLSQFIADIRGKGLEHLLDPIDGQQMPNQQIIMESRPMRDKWAGILGMPRLADDH